jgi:hypothetical protein
LGIRMIWLFVVGFIVGFFAALILVTLTGFEP